MSSFNKIEDLKLEISTSWRQEILFGIFFFFSHQFWDSQATIRPVRKNYRAYTESPFQYNIIIYILGYEEIFNLSYINNLDVIS